VFASLFVSLFALFVCYFDFCLTERCVFGGVFVVVVLLGCVVVVVPPYGSNSSSFDAFLGGYFFIHW